MHAVGSKGTVPLGWALYLPEEWCEDAERRARARIPEEIEFKKKPQLGKDLIERAGGWDIGRAPILGDEAYGENTRLRRDLDDAGFQYVFSIDKIASVFAPDTVFSLPERAGETGRRRTRLRPDRKPEPARKLIARLAPENMQTVTFRDGPDGTPVTSQFAFLRVPRVGAMDINIHWTFLPHEDPDASLAFYRDTLGFEVRKDVGYGGMRWITVGPADQPGTSIVLEPPAADPGITEDERRTIAEMMAKGTYARIVLATADLDGTFTRLQASGADIVQEPTEQPHGIRDCALRDPAGNLIRINELP